MVGVGASLSAQELSHESTSREHVAVEDTLPLPFLPPELMQALPQGDRSVTSVLQGLVRAAEEQERDEPFFLGLENSFQFLSEITSDRKLLEEGLKKWFEAQGFHDAVVYWNLNQEKTPDLIERLLQEEGESYTKKATHYILGRRAFALAAKLFWPLDEYDSLMEKAPEILLQIQILEKMRGKFPENIRAEQEALIVKLLSPSQRGDTLLRRIRVLALMGNNPEGDYELLREILSHFKNLRITGDVFIDKIPVEKDGNFSSPEFLGDKEYVYYPLPSAERKVRAIVLEGGKGVNPANPNFLKWAKSRKIGAERVDHLEGLAAAGEAAVKAGVDTLLIAGHGNSKGIRVGQDGTELTKENAAEVAKSFRGIKTIFFQSCRLGTASEMLQIFARESGAQIVANDTSMYNGDYPFAAKNSNWIVFTPVGKGLSRTPALMKANASKSWGERFADFFR